MFQNIYSVKVVFIERYNVTTTYNINNENKNENIEQFSVRNFQQQVITDVM